MQAKHVFSAGSSGGGKTTRLRERHARHDGPSIWVNHLDGTDIEDVPGVVCSSLTDMVEAVRSCSSLRRLRIDYRPPESGPEAAAVPKEFGRMMSAESGGEVCTQVILDEVQVLMPDSEQDSSRDINPVAWMLHEGRDDNIKVVASTQDPTEVFYPPIKNCKWFVWVGEAKVWHSGFLQYWGFDSLNLPDSNHRYALIRPSEPPEIVFRGETDPDY
jgi:hypothetical protein